MNNIRVPVLAAILLIMQWPGFLCGGQIDSVSPEDSLVVVTSRTPSGKRAGNGFVIGDGTLVVTAHHLVFAESELGRHQMAGLVTLFSPYLGQGCIAEIIAFDRQLDLAVLKADFPGHPALKLADDKSITSAQRMEIIGMPAIIRGMNPDTGFPLPTSRDVQRENLEVDFVAMRRQVPRFISLTGTGNLGDGWSGSAMLLPTTSTVMGCFTRLYSARVREPKTSQGSAINQVNELLDNTEYQKGLSWAKTAVSKPKDANQALLLFMQASRHFVRREHELAFEKRQAFLGLRPQSAFGYMLAASAAEKLDKREQAGEYYEKALTLNPHATPLKIFYAQYLSERQPDKALEILNKIWDSNITKPAVALLMFNILSEREEFERCSELLTEALEVNPENAYLWTNLGSCQFQSGNTDLAITSLTKAVPLLPEDGRLRGGLARVLEMAGRLDEAEIHFRKLLEIEPENPVVHMWLAKFLSKHRPPGAEEALKEAQTALALPLKGGLTKQKIEQFINELKSKSKEKATNTVDEKLKVKGL